MSNLLSKLTNKARLTNTRLAKPNQAKPNNLASSSIQPNHSSHLTHSNHSNQSSIPKLSFALRLSIALVLAIISLIGIAHQTKVFADTNTNYTWTAQKNGIVGDDVDWQSITSSADGTKLAAVVYSGSIYTSANSGTTWTEQTAAGSRNWYSITSSADGTKLAAVDGSNGSIYTSTDSGTTWTEATAAGSRSWRSITSSADGTKLAAVVDGGSIYTSANSGTTWTEQTAAGSRNWLSITSSTDGTKLAAVVYSGSIYTSANSGTTWTEQTAAGSRNWRSITSSTDGTKLAAVAFDENTFVSSVYISTDSGATWTQKDFASNMENGILDVFIVADATFSNNGTKLFVSGSNITYDTINDVMSESNGTILLSADLGTSWQEIIVPGSASIAKVSTNTDSSKLAVIGANSFDVGIGYIYTGTLQTPAPPTTPPVTPPNSSNQVTILSPTNPDNPTFSHVPITITTPTGTTLTCSSTTTETNLSQLDPTYQYPLGLTNFCFDTTNSSNQVSLSYVTNLKPNDVVARKYNSTTKTYANLPTSANPTISETTINGKHALVLTYTIVDNGPLDLDSTTGKIKDPIGLAMTNTNYNNLLGSLADTGTNTKLLTTIALSLVTLSLVALAVMTTRRRLHSRG